MHHSQVLGKDGILPVEQVWPWVQCLGEGEGLSPSGQREISQERKRVLGRGMSTLKITVLEENSQKCEQSDGLEESSVCGKWRGGVGPCLLSPYAPQVLRSPWFLSSPPPTPVCLRSQPFLLPLPMCRSPLCTSRVSARYQHCVRSVPVSACDHHCPYNSLVP